MNGSSKVVKDMEELGSQVQAGAAVFDRRALLLAQRLRVLGHIRKQLPAALASAMSISIDDVLQDTYFDAFRGLATFGGVDSDAAFHWLAAIASNRINDLIKASRTVKRGRGWKRLSQDDSMIRMLEDLAVSRRTPSRSAAGHEFVRALESAIEQLPSDLKRAITLRYIHQDAPAEIARRMDRTERAVHMLCNRGLKAVRRLLRTASLFV